MTKLLIQTQVYENYGAHDWDGQGECPQYWKAKGGCDYVVRNVDVCDMVETIVHRAGEQIEVDNDAFREYVIGYSIVADDFMTDFERSQLEYEGKILYPVQEISI